MSEWVSACCREWVLMLLTEWMSWLPTVVEWAREWVGAAMLDWDEYVTAMWRSKLEEGVTVEHSRYVDCSIFWFRLCLFNIFYSDRIWVICDEGGFSFSCFHAVSFIMELKSLSHSLSSATRWRQKWRRQGTLIGCAFYSFLAFCSFLKLDGNLFFLK